MRQVTWLGQGVPRTQFTVCGPDTPCPAGSTCVNGVCVSNALNPTLLRNVAPINPPKKQDNTALYVVGGILAAGVLYYAMK